MTFKELKSGYPLYMLDRANVSVEAYKVNSVSIPHLDAKLGGVASMVVDVEAEADGVRKSFCMLADNDVAYPNGCVLTINREHLVRELDAMQTSAEQALAQVDNNKKIIEKCKLLKADLDPVAREKQATEARFASLEGSLQKLTDMVQTLIS